VAAEAGRSPPTTPHGHLLMGPTAVMDCGGSHANRANDRLLCLLGSQSDLIKKGV